MCDAEPCALTNCPSEQYTSNLLILIALHELIIQNKKKRKRIYRINHNWWTLTHLVQITEIRILRDNTQKKSVLNNVHILVHVQSNRKKQNFCALRVFFLFLVFPRFWHFVFHANFRELSPPFSIGERVFVASGALSKFITINKLVETKDKCADVRHDRQFNQL